MKRMKSNILSLPLILLVFFLATTSLAIAQIKVTRVSSPDQLKGKNGIVYALPRTLVIVDLCVTKTQQFTGPLAEFSADFVGINEVITKDAVGYSLESAMIRTATEPDPGQVYLIEKEDKSQGEVWISFGKQSPLMTLEMFEKTMGPEGFSSWNKELYITPESGHLFRKYTDSPTREVTDTIIRKVSIDTLVYEEKIFRHSREEYSDREKAQDAADRIRQIEQDKYNLLIGYPETAYTKDALEYMIQQLEEQRLEYLKLFTGVTVKETIRFSYTVFPESDRETQEYQIAALSKTNGMIAPDGQNDIVFSLKSGDTAGSAINTTEGQDVSGMVYQLPGTFQSVLTFNGKELVSKRIEILQLGTKMSLPPSFKRIEFNLETGALQSVILE
jgi:hypothetical protein